jgi:hypothetical protein
MVSVSSNNRAPRALCWATHGAYQQTKWRKELNTTAAYGFDVEVSWDLSHDSLLESPVHRIGVQGPRLPRKRKREGGTAVEVGLGKWTIVWQMIQVRS